VVGVPPVVAIAPSIGFGPFSVWLGLAGPPPCPQLPSLPPFVGCQRCRIIVGGLYIVRHGRHLRVTGLLFPFL
jgi:hypothetical protein